MDCSSGNSWGCAEKIRVSGSEGDPMDERKRRRMESNRESAKRSRMRKQKHLDDLTAQVGHLRSENAHILKNIDLVTRHYLGVESENSVLKAQAMELNQRLESLNEMISFGSIFDFDFDFDSSAEVVVHHHQPGLGPGTGLVDGFVTNPWMHMNQPILASPDTMFPY
ncbi:hypothetical protein DM860_013314 [Cuscuta australis]|uniref:BZIP domain-containing protein n=1 Tax=Cuscuta australis TaxID=267555 RepID=A0A328DSI6_9ASTE|nr:hypothetical protein DM860_013314 [Cuscuta australis]